MFARELPNGIGKTPALAWSSWNYFATSMTQNITLEIGDALVSTGLAKLGFRYVNIDAGWAHTERNATTGKIYSDVSKFPNIRELSDALHEKGLLFGMYTDLTDHSCGTGPGSLGHYETDAMMFAHDFQIDYLKVDFCGPTSGLNLKPLNRSCSPGALTAGGDIRRANTTIAEALLWCEDTALCAGFTTKSNQSCDAQPGQIFDIYFKDSDARPNGDHAWTLWQKPGAGRVSWQSKPQYDHWMSLGRALNSTGRPIYYSICPHSNISDALRTHKEWQGSLAYAPPKDWTAKQRLALANSILVEYTNTWDAWYIPPSSRVHGGIITDIDSMVDLTNLSFSVPGSWNDADMLQLCTYGKGRTPGAGMTLAEYRAHYSVWAVMASPLILSADLRTIARDHPDCLALMLNAEIVAVNQDAGGRAPFLVKQSTNSTEISHSSITSQVFARPLGSLPVGAPGFEMAVVLLNRDEMPSMLSVSWSELGIASDKTVAVRDVIAQKNIPPRTNGFQATIAKHDVSFLRLKVL